MFWRAARRRYPDLTRDDPDVAKFLRLSDQFQCDVYKGIGGLVHDLGHRWIAARTPRGRVLEIGFGAGRHARFFARNWNDYFVSEYSGVHSRSPAWQRVRSRAVLCDAMRLPFPDGAFATVLSIYNLEHISDLRAALAEAHRVLKAAGVMLVGLPCEGGLAWNLGRELTTRPTFQRRYQINYDKVIAYEHRWDFHGVQRAIVSSGLFKVARRSFFPFLVPSVHLNLIACLECVKR